MKSLPAGGRNVLQHVATEEGRVRMESNTWRHDYFLKDHLGNVRMMLADNGTLLEKNHYYPFGLSMAGMGAKQVISGIADNKYKFNAGTELNTDFDINLYETAFRGLDPQLGRFWQVDLMSDNGERYSPFNFAFNNPVLLNDPTGLWPDSIMTSDGTWAYTANPWMEHVVVVAGKGKPRYGGMLSYGSSYDPSKDDYYLEWQSQIRGNGTGVGLGRSALTGQREELPYFKIVEEVNRRLAEALSGVKLSDISSGATENLKDKLAAVTSKDYWLHLALTVSQGPINITVDQLKGLVSTIENLSGKSSGEIIGYVGVELGIAFLTRRAGRFTRAAKTGSSVLSAGDALRIENAATRIGKPITVVGSRAKGTAGAFSDWDYVIEGLNNKSWKQIKNSLPGSKSVLDNTPRNIDIFKTLDPTKPHITIYPR